MFGRNYLFVLMEEAAAAEAGGGGGAPVSNEVEVDATHGAPTNGEPQQEPVTPEPVEPVAPEQQEPAKPKDDAQPSKVDFNDPVSVIDSVERSFVKAGVDGNVLVDSYLRDGQFDAKQVEALVKKVGEDQANLLLGQLATNATKLVESKRAEAKALADMAGGEEQLKDVLTWAAMEESGIEQPTRDAINEMLDRGGEFSQIALQYLMLGFRVSNGESVLPVTGEGQVIKPSATAQSNGYITYKEYTQGIKEARTDGQRAALERRARATLSQGNAAEYGWR